MSNFWRFKASSDKTELYITGDIVSEESWFGSDVWPKMFRDELADQGGRDITVRMNSRGGDVFAGIEIYNALKDYSGNVEVIVDGLSASIASIIAMAGSKITMNDGAVMMIHNPSVFAIGDASELTRAIDALTVMADSMANIYASRSGIDKKEILSMMDAETWLSAEEAVAKGFADQVSTKSPLANAVAKAKAEFKSDVVASSMAKFFAKFEGKDEVSETATAYTNGEIDLSNIDKPEEAKPEVAVEVKSEPEVVVEKPVKKTKVKEVKGDNMTATEEIKAVAAAQVVEKPEVTQVAVAKQSTFTKSDAKRAMGKAFAMVAEGKENDARAYIDKKFSAAIDGNSNFTATEVFAGDINKAFQRVGSIGSLISRLDNTGAETWRELVETRGLGFQRVAGIGGAKPVDAPTFTNLTWTPVEWALIVPWFTGVAKRSPVAVYQYVVDYVARELARLEDHVILSYAGGTVAPGIVDGPTGLFPILTAAGGDRVLPVADYSADAILEAFGLGFGRVESTDEMVLISNLKTWGKLATVRDTQGRPVFTTVGEMVQVGALGSFRLVISTLAPDDEIVMGVAREYLLVTAGGIEQMVGTEATIGAGENVINLFTQNAEALRSSVNLDGGVRRVKAFVKLVIA